MIPLFKTEWIKVTDDESILGASYINPEMIITIESRPANSKNKSAIEMRGGGTRYDVRKPEELNMALIVHCNKRNG